MNVPRIFAIEGDDVFDRSYADLMRLPFDKGWERWAVIRDGQTLFESDRYEECSRFLQH